MGKSNYLLSLRCWFFSDSLLSVQLVLWCRLNNLTHIITHIKVRYKGNGSASTEVGGAKRERELTGEVLHD